jgi:hypothetical protein
MLVFLRYMCHDAGFRERQVYVPKPPAGYSCANAFGPRDITENTRTREKFLVTRENIKLLDSRRRTGQKCPATEGVCRNCDHLVSRIYRLLPIFCTGFLQTACFRAIQKKKHKETEKLISKISWRANKRKLLAM